MKKYINIRLTAFLAAITAMMLFQACEDEETFDVVGDNTNRIYLNDGSYTVNQYRAFPFTIIHTPQGSIGNVEASFPVKSTMAASNQITVALEVDNSLIEMYNAANETDFIALPDGFAELDQPSLTIPQGAYQSDSLTVSIAPDRYNELTEERYLLPIRLTTVQSGSAQLSNNLNTLYLIVTTEETNLYNNASEDDVVGARIEDRSGWTAELDIPTSFGGMSNMLDGSTWSYWYVTPAQEAMISVDMGQEYTNITEMSIHTYSGNYTLTAVSVLTSTDGENWQDNGSAELSTSSAQQYIKFYAPVNAQYLRIHIDGWSGGFLVVSEFDVYTQE